MPFSQTHFSIKSWIRIVVIISILLLINGIVSSAQAYNGGYALQFDGFNDYVELPETITIFAPGWEDTKSVSLWIKPDIQGPVCQIQDVAWCDAVLGDSPRWWGISHGVLSSLDRIWVWNKDSGSIDRIGIEYTAGEWMHLTMVHSGGNLRAYKNGIQVGTDEPSGTTAQPAGLPVIQIGGVVPSSTRRWVFQRSD